MFSRILQWHCWDLVIFCGGITCKFNFLTNYRAIYIIYFIFDESWQFVFSEVVVTKFSFLIGCPFQVLWLEREGFSWYFFFPGLCVLPFQGCQLLRCLEYVRQKENPGSSPPCSSLCIRVPTALPSRLTFQHLVMSVTDNVQGFQV